MRKSPLVTMIATAVLTIACNQAYARPITLSGIHTKDDLKAACGKDYVDNADGYGCTKKCRGGYCGVNCTSPDKCKGAVPLRGRPSNTLGGILHAPSAGIKSSNRNAP